MKVLSIHQPWAWLIAEGHKRVENRTWETKHRGPLLIQASKRWRSAEVTSILEDLAARDLIPAVPPLATLEAELGQVIARVQLTGCRHVDPDDPDPWAIAGHVAFELEAVERLEPFPVRGMQRLFNLPPELEPKLAPLRMLLDELLETTELAPAVIPTTPGRALRQLRGYQRGAAKLARIKRELASLEADKKAIAESIKTKKRALAQAIDELDNGQLVLELGGSE